MFFNSMLLSIANFIITLLQRNSEFNTYMQDVCLREGS